MTFLRLISGKPLWFLPLVYLVLFTYVRVTLFTESWITGIKNINNHQCKRLSHEGLFSPEDVVAYKDTALFGGYSHIQSWLHSPFDYPLGTIF